MTNTSQPTPAIAPEAAMSTASTVKTAPRSSRKTRLYLRRFARNRLALVGVAILTLLILTTVLAPLVTPWSYDDPDFLNLSTAPTGEHWFGTTDAGNDLFAQTVHGLGRSLTIALLVAIGTTIIAALIGTAAALYGGRIERVLIEFIHLLLAVPTFLFIALIVGDSGGDWKILTLVLIAFGWMMSARVIWSMALSIRSNDYIRAAHYMGVSRPRIVVRHMIPNIGSLLVIQFTLAVVATIASETGLSFLGLGVKLPDVSLGTLLQTGAGSLTAAPWQFWFPAATLTLLTVSIAFISDGLRDALDPNSAAGGHA